MLPVPYHKKQATLPEELEATDHIEHMRVGDSGYMVPWGMWIDKSRQCWLHPQYTVTPTRFGTSTMRVERHEDGYHVWPPAGETWDPKNQPSYCSPADTRYIPVAELRL